MCRTDTYQSLVEILRTNRWLQTDSAKPWLRGLHGSSVAYLFSTLAIDFADSSFLIVLPSQNEAEKVVQDLPAYGFEGALLFPEWQNFLYDGISPTQKFVAERLICLHQLLVSQSQPLKSPLPPFSKGGRGDLREAKQGGEGEAVRRTVIVTSIKALMHKTLPRSVLESVFRTLHVGDEIDPDGVVELLLRSGYRRVDLVEVKGEFARRGDILDVYPLTAAPIRIDFFGDEIETIRTFDPS
ncbi:hypothetical protein HYR99_24740, partial [Candidatus Poribacteria bacterium]|nr:hypothetical protein [Candidatus Poribacteria bacterium]